MLYEMVLDELGPKGNSATSYAVDYEGTDINAVVGSHTVRVTIEFVTGSDRCFDMHFTIDDTDECAITNDPGQAALYPLWTHNCDKSTVCQNTLGSYNCACKVEGEFGAVYSGSVKKPSSPGYLTTFGMCHGFESSEVPCLPVLPLPPLTSRL